MRHSILLLAAGLVTAGAALGLGACDMGTRQVSSTYPTVTYEIDRDDPSEAADMAAEYCRQYERSARQRGIAEYGGNQQATFECV